MSSQNVLGPPPPPVDDHVGADRAMPPRSSSDLVTGFVAPLCTDARSAHSSPYHPGHLWAHRHEPSSTRTMQLMSPTSHAEVPTSQPFASTSSSPQFRFVQVNPADRSYNAHFMFTFQVLPPSPDTLPTQSMLSLNTSSRVPLPPRTVHLPASMPKRVTTGQRPFVTDESWLVLTTEGPFKGQAKLTSRRRGDRRPSMSPSSALSPNVQAGAQKKTCTVEEEMDGIRAFSLPSAAYPTSLAKRRSRKKPTFKVDCSVGVLKSAQAPLDEEPSAPLSKASSVRHHIDSSQQSWEPSNSDVLMSSPPFAGRPFKCQKCSRSFNRGHDLSRHVKIHSGIKMHPCTYCPDRTFSRKDALRRHQQVQGCVDRHKESVVGVRLDDSAQDDTLITKADGSASSDKKNSRRSSETAIEFGAFTDSSDDHQEEFKQSQVTVTSKPHRHFDLILNALEPGSEWQYGSSGRVRGHDQGLERKTTASEKMVFHHDVTADLKFENPFKVPLKRLLPREPGHDHEALASR